MRPTLATLHSLLWMQEEEVRLREAGRAEELSVTAEAQERAGRLFGRASRLRQRRLALLDRCGIAR